jgi:hypothetical protein
VNRLLMTFLTRQSALLAVFVATTLLLAACGDDGPEALVTEYEAYGLQFTLPEGWRDDRVSDVGMEVGGGFGFGSPDYEGLTYLRLHQGEGFAVLGSWEPVDDAAAILEAAFATDISSPESISVLGVEGTYATGLIDQGQGIGAVHVVIDAAGEARQFGFVGVVADDWSTFEPTFLKIIEGITRSL